MLDGHSGGGAIAHAAADARPGRIARVVYVDSWPLGHGGVINDELPAVNGEVVTDVEFVDLPTGHWPQLTRPRELAATILAAVDR